MTKEKKLGQEYKWHLWQCLGGM